MLISNKILVLYLYEKYEDEFNEPVKLSVISSSDSIILVIEKIDPTTPMIMKIIPIIITNFITNHIIPWFMLSVIKSNFLWYNLQYYHNLP